MRQIVTGRRSGRRGLGLAAALALALAGNRAAATAPGGRAEGQVESAATPPGAPVPLAVAVRTDLTDLGPEAIRRAVEDELQSWVVSVDPAAPVPAYAPILAVDISAARGEIAVQYVAPGRKPLSRVIPLPAGTEAALRAVAWLAGNLARDQASELLPPAASPPPPEAPPRPFAPAPAPPASAPVPIVTAPARPVAADHRYVPVAVSLFFPLASNAGNPDARTHLSANVLYGRIGALELGLQVGLVSQVAADATGMLVGVVNQVGGDVDGVQLGVVNRAQGHVVGGQVGLVNHAGDVRGAQLGLVNVGRNVRGVQLGLVNISDDIDGLPIGIINVSATGGVHPVLWTSGTEQLAVGLKFSTRNVYTLFSGATESSDGLRRYGPGLAIGLRFPMRRLVVESDVGGAYLLGGPLTGVSRADGLRDDLALASWRALLGVQLHRRLTFFGGGALTARLHFLQVVGQDVSYEVGPELFAGVQL